MRPRQDAIAQDICLKTVFAALILIASLCIFPGCTVKAVPSAVPAIREYTDLSLSGVSVDLVNAEANDQELRLVNKFIVNRKEWTGHLVSSLSQEIEKRGAVIASGSPLKIRLSMPEISAVMGQSVWRFSVKTKAMADSGWEKTYEGSAAASLWSTGGFGGADYIAGRAASATVAEIVKEMLGDADFLEQLKGRK